jgi:hypothetical protein
MADFKILLNLLLFRKASPNNNKTFRFLQTSSTAPTLKRSRTEIGRFLKDAARFKLGPVEIVMAGSTSEQATTKLLEDFKEDLDDAVVKLDTKTEIANKSLKARDGLIKQLRSENQHLRQALMAANKLTAGRVRFMYIFTSILMS